MNIQMTDWEEIRQSFIRDITSCGELTDHTSTMPIDYLYHHLTIPAFKCLRAIELLYIEKSPDKSLWPTWFRRAMEEFETEGGSPRQMQREILRKLK